MPLPSVERPLIHILQVSSVRGDLLLAQPCLETLQTHRLQLPHVGHGHRPGDAPPGLTSAVPVGTAWTIFLDGPDPK